MKKQQPRCPKTKTDYLFVWKGWRRRYTIKARAFFEKNHELWLKNRTKIVIIKKSMDFSLRKQETTWFSMFLSSSWSFFRLLTRPASMAEGLETFCPKFSTDPQKKKKTRNTSINQNWWQRNTNSLNFDAFTEIKILESSNHYLQSPFSREISKFHFETHRSYSALILVLYAKFPNSPL